MSQKYQTRTNVKKLEDSFSDKYSDSDQDDTKIQPNDEQKSFKKSSKIQNKIESKTIHVKKKEEYSRRFDNVSGVKNIKEQQEQDRNDYKKESKILKNQVEKVPKYQKNEQIEEKQQRKTERSRQRFKQTRSETKRDEMENEANEIMSNIDQAYEQDVELYKKKKPADKKLKLMPYVMMRLKELELAKSFIKMDGMQLFIRWLCPNEQTLQETSLTVKIHVLNLLLDLNVTKQNIQNSEQLEQLIKKYRRSKYEVLREISDKIISKWKIIKATQSN